MERESTDTLVPVVEYVVAHDDVDDAGHMTTRRYSELAEGAAIDAIASCSHADQARPPGVRQVLARQYREQFERTAISVELGLVDLTASTAVVHVELRNRERDELASAHRIELTLAAPVHTATLESSLTVLGSEPETSRPRRLPDSSLFLWTADELLAAELEVWSDRHVEPDECDDDGIFRLGPADLAWGRYGRTRSPTQWQFQTPDGRQHALTVVEYRRSMASRPTVGDHLMTVAANVAIQGNLRVRREWTIEPESKVVHSAGEYVDLLVDLAERRAAEIPTSIRRELGRYYHPELGRDERRPDPLSIATTTREN